MVKRDCRMRKRTPLFDRVTKFSGDMIEDCETSMQSALRTKKGPQGCLYTKTH